VFLLEKKSFLLYLENFEQIQLLSMEERGQLLTAIFEYEISGATRELPGALGMCFSFIRQRLDYNREAYDQKCVRNQENGRKGGRPKKDSAAKKQDSPSPAQTEKTEGFSPKPKKADLDTELDMVLDMDMDMDTELDMDMDQTPPPPLEGAERERNREKNDGGSDDVANLSTTSDRFENFWAVYPRKAAKGAARNAWDKLQPDEGLAETIVSAVKAQSRSDQWLRDGGQFIPFPAKYLSDRRWEDEQPQLHPPAPDRTYDLAAFDDYCFLDEIAPFPSP
jgi:hypothetical protein